MPFSWQRKVADELHFPADCISFEEDDLPGCTPNDTTPHPGFQEAEPRRSIQKLRIALPDDEQQQGRESTHFKSCIRGQDGTPRSIFDSEASVSPAAEIQSQYIQHRLIHGAFGVGSRFQNASANGVGKADDVEASTMDKCKHRAEISTDGVPESANGVTSNIADGVRNTIAEYGIATDASSPTAVSRMHEDEQDMHQGTSTSKQHTSLRFVGEDAKKRPAYRFVKEVNVHHKGKPLSPDAWHADSSGEASSDSGSNVLGDQDLRSDGVGEISDVRTSELFLQSGVQGGGMDRSESASASLERWRKRGVETGAKGPGGKGPGERKVVRGENGGVGWREEGALWRRQNGDVSREEADVSRGNDDVRHGRGDAPLEGSNSESVLSPLREDSSVTADLTQALSTGASTLVTDGLTVTEGLTPTSGGEKKFVDRAAHAESSLGGEEAGSCCKPTSAEPREPSTLREPPGMDTFSLEVAESRPGVRMEFTTGGEAQGSSFKPAVFRPPGGVFTPGAGSETQGSTFKSGVVSPALGAVFPPGGVFTPGGVFPPGVKSEPHASISKATSHVSALEEYLAQSEECEQAPEAPSAVETAAAMREAVRRMREDAALLALRLSALYASDASNLRRTAQSVAQHVDGLQTEVQGMHSGLLAIQPPRSNVRSFSSDALLSALVFVLLSAWPRLRGLAVRWMATLSNHGARLSWPWKARPASALTRPPVAATRPLVAQQKGWPLSWRVLVALGVFQVRRLIASQRQEQVRRMAARTLLSQWTPIAERLVILKAIAAKGLATHVADDQAPA